jgi:putative membrane protein
MVKWILVSWAANALVLGITAGILDSVSAGDSFWTLIFAAAVFGILNTVLKPVLKVVTFPLAVLTLGVAWFFVSMLMLWLTDVIVPKFNIDGFWHYVVATIIVWIVNLLVDHVFRSFDRYTGAPAAA